jgi:hypothetical protein
VVDAPYPGRAHQLSNERLGKALGAESPDERRDADVAVVLFTSGTTSEPKAAVLRTTPGTRTATRRTREFAAWSFRWRVLRFVLHSRARDAPFGNRHGVNSDARVGAQPSSRLRQWGCLCARIGARCPVRVAHFPTAIAVGRLLAESVTVVQGRGQVWGTPKSHEQREVPIPRFLIDDIAEHVRSKKPDELVFTGVRGGGALRAAVFRRAGFDQAAEAIGEPGLHPHELRRTAASLAIASGANVKLVQQMLGHKSATVTLDQYGHLFGDDLDTIADRLDLRAQEIRNARPSRLHTDADVVNLPTSSDRPAQ